MECMEKRNLSLWGEESSFPRRVLAIVAVLGLFCSACARTSHLYEEVAVPETRMAAYLQDKPEPLHFKYARILREGRRNFVLNQMEAGLSSMEFGDYYNAEKSFDEALINIEAVYKDDKNAEKALSLWYQEGMKDFKGEPYERAMAYYYRGLLYLRKGDFENARASFLGGLIQDSMAVEERFRQDFALLTFMAGWASQMNGDIERAREFYEETKSYNSSFVPPSPEDNVLIIAESGGAPRKVTDGKNSEILRFVRGYNPWQSVEIKAFNEYYQAQKIEDIYRQAITRGEREIDRINKGKAVYKETTDAVGDVAIVAGAATVYAGAGIGNRDASLVGLAIMGVGVLAKVTASAMEADADTRQWTNLPDSVFILTFKSPELRGDEIEVFFMDVNGSKMRELASNPKVELINGKFGFAWVRSNSSFSH